MKHKDGRTFWAEVNLRCAVIEGKSRILAILRDITERKQAEEILRQKEYMIKSASSAIATADLEGNMTYANPAFLRAWGFDYAEELAGRPFKEFWMVEDRLDEIMSALQEEGQWYDEVQARRKDGTLFDVQVSASVVFNKEGKPVSLMSSSVDITDRRQAEEALKTSEAKYRSVTDDVLDTSEVGLFILDADFKIVWINQAIETFFGLKRDQVIGKDKRNLILTQISGVFENPQDFIDKVISTYDDNTYVERFECHVLGDGKRQNRWLEHRSFPVLSGLWAGGRMEHYIDITERRQAEEKLKDSEKRSRAWLEYSPACTKIVDLDFNLQYMSTAGIEGLKIDDVTQFYGKPFPFDLYPESFRNSITKNLERVKETGEVITQETSVLDTEGNELWYHTTFVPVNDDEGRIDYIMVVSIDTTERKQAEEKMRDLAKFPSENPNPVLRITKDGLLLHSNPASESFLKEEGYQVGGPVSDQWRQMVSEVFASGCEKSFEIPHTGRIFSFMFTPVTEAGYVNLYGRDITDRRQAQQALHTSEEKFRLMFETSPLGMVLCEMDGTFVQANRAYLDIIGYSHQEMVKLRYWDVTPRDYDADEAEQLRAMEMTGRYGPYEKEYIRKTGERIPVLLNGMVVKVADRVERIWSIVEDITERKQVEDERERLVKNLAAKTEDLENIVYVSSHDLRSPLLNIQGYSGELGFSCDKITEVIENSHTPQEIRDNLSKVLQKDIPTSLKYITASADKMNMLLVGLLKLSRLGTAALETETLDMNIVLDQILSAMQYQIKECQAEVIVDALPCCLGDYGQITQVFTNLLDNALKYLDPNRKAKIHISGHTDDQRSVYCAEDNGVGIDKNYFDNIFEIFHQLNPTEPPTGQGLGLTIIRRILDRHNGKIWVESKPGKGSRFYVALPNP